MTATSSIPNLVVIGVALPYGVSRQLTTGSSITPSHFVLFSWVVVEGGSRSVIEIFFVF